VGGGETFTGEDVDAGDGLIATGGHILSTSPGLDRYIFTAVSRDLVTCSETK
jgi:hypothetical protein